MWQEAIDELDRAGIEWVTAPLFNLGYGLVELGDVEAARPIVTRLIEFGRDHDDEWTATIGELLSAYVAFGAGELDAAEETAAAALDKFKQQGALFHAAESCILRAYVAEQRGDPDLARSELAVAAEAVADTSIFEQAEAQLLHARVALLAEEVDAAAGHVRNAISHNRTEPNLITTASILHEVARLLHHHDRSPEATTLIGVSQQAFAIAQAMPARHQQREAEAIGVGPAEPMQPSDMLTLAEQALATT